MQSPPVEHRVGARLLAEHVEQVVGRLEGTRRPRHLGPPRQRHKRSESRGALDVATLVERVEG